MLRCDGTYSTTRLLKEVKVDAQLHACSGQHILYNFVVFPLLCALHNASKNSQNTSDQRYVDVNVFMYQIIITYFAHVGRCCKRCHDCDVTLEPISRRSFFTLQGTYEIKFRESCDLGMGQRCSFIGNVPLHFILELHCQKHLREVFRKRSAKLLLHGGRHSDTISLLLRILRALRLRTHRGRCACEPRANPRQKTREERHASIEEILATSSSCLLRSQSLSFATI